MGWTNSDNKFGLSPYIVGTVLGDGCNYTSVQTAINDIAAGPLSGTLYLRPGTYSETITIPAGVSIQIVGAQAADEISIVSIFGSITMSGAGSSLGLENLGIGFSTVVAFVQTTGTAVIKNCVINSSADSAIQVSTAGTSFKALDCQISTSSINDLVQVTDATTVTFDGCSFDSPTANLVGYGGAIFTATNCKFNHLVVALATSDVTIQDSRTDNPVNPAYNVDAAAVFRAYGNIVNTSDASTFFITGTGTFVYADLILLADKALDPAVTQFPQDWKPYAQSGAGPAPSAATVRGTACFDNSQFTVTDGFVQGSGFTTTYNTDGGSASPSGGAINIFGTSGVYTTASGSTVTVAAPPFQDAAGNFGSNPNLGTFSTGAVTAFLPTGASIGSENIYVATDAGPMVVQASATDFIRIGTSLSVMNGTATNTNPGDSLTIRYDPASSTWYATSVVGAWVVA